MPSSNLDLATSYMRKMTGHLGIWEHATISESIINEGLTTDDNARAYQVALRTGVKLASEKQVYLQFLQKAVSPLGWHNDMNKEGLWDDEPGYGEWFGRGMEAVYEGTKMGDSQEKEICRKIWEQERIRSISVTSTRVAAQLALAGISGMTEILTAAWERNHSPGWEWLEPGLYYDNARLPLALFAGGINNLGRKTLDFLISSTWNEQKDCFSWIGHSGWWKKGKEKAIYDQQPVEAGGMVEVCVMAYKVTQDKKYLDWAKKAWEWYFGRNIIKGMIWDEKTGGVRDGLGQNSCNLNEGAEAVLSFLLAGLALADVTR